MIETIASAIYLILNWVYDILGKLTYYIVGGIVPSLLPFLKGFFYSSPILCIFVIIAAPLILPYIIPSVYGISWFVLTSLFYFMLKNPLKFLALSLIGSLVVYILFYDTLRKVEFATVRTENEPPNFETEY